MIHCIIHCKQILIFGKCYHLVRLTAFLAGFDLFGGCGRLCVYPPYQIGLVFRCMRDKHE